MRLFIDRELGLPIRFEAYDWPAATGGAARAGGGVHLLSTSDSMSAWANPTSTRPTASIRSADSEARLTRSSSSTEQLTLGRLARRAFYEAAIRRLSGSRLPRFTAQSSRSAETLADRLELRRMQGSRSRDTRPSVIAEDS